jgi:hypothetical protein
MFATIVGRWPLTAGCWLLSWLRPDSAKNLCYNAAIDIRPAGPMSGQPGDIRKDKDES